MCIGFEVDIDRDSRLDFFSKLWPDHQTVKKCLALKNPDPVRGCKHPEAEAKFCGQCGKETWVKKDNTDLIGDWLGDMMYDSHDGICILDGDHHELSHSYVGVSPSSESKLDASIFEKLNRLKKRLGLKESAPIKIVYGETYG
jgi:hypothetical protein